MPEVMTFGECMAVLYPPDPVTIDAAPLLKWDIGGAEANCAIALARMGVSVRFHSRVGNDPFGRKIIATLSGEGVDTSAVSIDATRPTGVFFVSGWQMGPAVSSIIGAVQLLPTWGPKTWMRHSLWGLRRYI